MLKSKIGTVEAIMLVLTIIIVHTILSLPRDIVSAQKSASLLNLFYVSIISIIITLIVYKLFKNFRVRVIEPAIKELREKELLDIYNVEYIKTGRKITSIKFYVKDLEPRTYKFEIKKDFDKPKKEVSSFANFTQRKYDYDKLEKQLLCWANDEEDYE